MSTADMSTELLLEQILANMLSRSRIVVDYTSAGRNGNNNNLPTDYCASGALQCNPSSLK